MDKTILDIFNGFVKIAENLNKFGAEEVIASNGVFIWNGEGLLSITTFKEKFEKDVTIFLTKKFKFNPYVIIFLSKYFEIEEISLTKEGIELVFSGLLSNGDMLSDKKVEDILPILSKVDNNKYAIILDYITDTDVTYNEISNIFKMINENADFSGEVFINTLDKDKLMLDTKPVDIDQDGFYLRLSKSVFRSINKKDSIQVRCIPYKNNRTTFLSIATVSKEQCSIITLFNALRI